MKEYAIHCSHAKKNATFLNYRWEESTSGPPRKYYIITPEGETFLGTLNVAWSELNQSVNKITQNKKMNKTVTINLANTAFVINEMAYLLPQEYLNQLKQTYKNTEGSNDILEDIEARIAELFKERMKSN